jgi:hypothetical protein
MHPDAPDFQAFDLRNKGVAGEGLVEFIVAIGTDNTGTKVRVLASRVDVTERHPHFRLSPFAEDYEQGCWREAVAHLREDGVYLATADLTLVYVPPDHSVGVEAEVYWDDLGDALTERDGWETYTY